MSHLTHEQFEEMIYAPEVNDHLDRCMFCRATLAEKRALAQRLRTAFDAVGPEPTFAAEIKKQLKAARRPQSRSHLLRWSIRRISYPAAAAAVLVMALLIGNYALKPPSAVAAGAELARIHAHNLSDDDLHYTNGSYEEVAAYFKTNLGFSPSMPTLRNGMKLRGCCVRYFRGQITGSYVVDTSHGVISVVVVTDTPESLGLANEFTYHKHRLWRDSFENNNIVTIRLGDYSYCAVGEVSYGYLADLLLLLVVENGQM